MNTTTIAPSQIARGPKPGNPRLDGEGSLQVHLDDQIEIGHAKVFAVYGKGGKNKGKERPRVCSKPCGLIKRPVDKNGKPLVHRCPVQLAYDNSQPFLRLCSVKGQQGYRVNVTSPVGPSIGVSTASSAP